MAAPAALSTILIGEVLDVRATVLSQEGNPVATAGDAWDTGSAGAVAEATVDGVDPRLATVEGVASGPDTLEFTVDDGFGGTATGTLDIRVLDADRFSFFMATSSAVRFDKTLLALKLLGSLDLDLIVQPDDERKSEVDYTGSVTGLVWQNSTGKVKFAYVGGSPPGEFDQVTGVLHATVRTKGVGTDTITVSGLNSQGQPFSTVVQVTVLGPYEITVEQA